jgi:hypothetical protein
MWFFLDTLGVDTSRLFTVLVGCVNEATDSTATYRAIQHLLALISSLLDMTLQGTRVKRFQELKAAQ